MQSMRALALLVAGLCSIAGALEARPVDSRTCREGGRSPTCVDPGTGGNSAPPPLLSILPANGAGVPVMAPGEVCEAFASELVGQFVCMKGDGTSVNAPGITLTKSGAVTTTEPRICPNGRDCDPLAVQSFDGAGAKIASSIITSPAADFSLCVMTRVRIEGLTLTPIALSSNTYITSALAALPATLRLNTGATFTPNASIPAAGSWNFICGTYQRVGGASNNIGASYVNGAAGTSSSTLALPAGTQVTIGNDAFNGAQDIALAIYTEKVLSAATISAMSAMVHGTPLATTEGTPVTFGRGSTISCPTPDGMLTLIRANWPCITRPPGFGGPALMLQQSAPFTNRLIKSQELDTWTLTEATVGANLAATPMATLTGERLFATDTTAEHLVARGVTVTEDGTRDVVSVFLKAGSVSYAFLRYAGTRYAYINLTTGQVATSDAADLVGVEPYADGWWRLWLLVTGTNDVTNPEVAFGPSNAFGVSSYPGTVADYVDAWGAQFEASNTSWHPQTYVRTDGTSASLSISGRTIPAHASAKNAEGCVGASFQQWPPGPQGSPFFQAVVFDFSASSAVLKTGGSGSLETGLLTNDGTTSTSATGPSFEDGVQRGVATWIGATKTVRLGNGLVASGAYDGTMNVTDTPWHIGNEIGGNSMEGYISDISIGDKADACNN